MNRRPAPRTPDRIAVRSWPDRQGTIETEILPGFRPKGIASFGRQPQGIDIRLKFAYACRQAMKNDAWTWRALLAKLLPYFLWFCVFGGVILWLTARSLSLQIQGSVAAWLLANLSLATEPACLADSLDRGHRRLHQDPPHGRLAY